MGGGKHKPKSGAQAIGRPVELDRTLSAPLRELHAKSRTSQQEFHEVQTPYHAKLERIKSEIGTIKEFDYSLNRLKKAGADPQGVLHYLAMEVIGSSRPWLRDLRRRKRSIKRLALQLRGNANDLEHTYGDENLYPDLYRMVRTGEHEGPVIPACERVPRSLIQELRSRADELDGFACEWGHLLKEDGPTVKRGPVATLLLYVYGTTRELNRFFVPLAEMLSDVYEKYHIKKKVSAESLAKMFQRNVKPRLPAPDKTLT